MVVLPPAAQLSGNQSTQIEPPVVAALLDSIRSAFNTGSIFRAADGAGLSHLFLCGTTTTPSQAKLQKTALGSEGSVGWSYHPNCLDLARKIKETGLSLWGLETTHGADSLFEVITQPLPPVIVLAVGNEVTGLDPSLIPMCDRLIYIPMLGSKESLNVATAFGIAAYLLRFSGIFSPRNNLPPETLP